MDSGSLFILMSRSLHHLPRVEVDTSSDRKVSEWQGRAGLGTWDLDSCVVWRDTGPCVFSHRMYMCMSKPVALFRPEWKRCERWDITYEMKSGLALTVKLLSDWVLD